ncbi:Uncharacterised protein [Burkholderia cepacia]|nr:hypothetical protein DM41_2876 [Burkholderia cepacia ATCC 25416]SPU85376.1 Uncharacterised protein [Burkholderia cepacia]
MPKVGTVVCWIGRKGGNAHVFSGVVESRKEWHHGRWNEERLNVPCVRRLRIALSTGGHMHPMVKRLDVVRGTA